MRRIGSFLLLLWCLCASGQNKPVLYDFNEIPQSLLLNPGTETNVKWFASVPFLSGVYGNIGSNQFVMNDIFANDGIDVNLKFRDRVLNTLQPNDEFSGAIQLEYFNLGFTISNPNLFLSIGGYLEIDAITYWPQDVAFLVFDGNANQLNRRYNLSDLNSSGSIVNVMHAGGRLRVNNNLTVGARGKIYSGILDYRSIGNRGYLVNTVGDNNRIATTLNADVRLRTSGIEALRTTDSYRKELIKRAAFGGDLGIGIDLGFTYHLSSQTTVTGSILDLGFIYHANDAKSYTLNGNATVEGIQIDVLQQLSDLNTDFWQDLVDDVEAAIPFETSTKGYFSMRQTKIYGSLRHDFGESVDRKKGGLDCNCRVGPARIKEARAKYKNAVGGQLFLINRPKGPQAAVTGFYTRRLGNALAVKTTYTIDKFNFTNIGLGLNLQAGPINLYAIAENLLGYQNISASKYASFQFGLNLVSWGNRK